MGLLLPHKTLSVCHHKSKQASVWKQIKKREVVNWFIKRTGNPEALMYFGINDSKAFDDKCSVELLEERTFFPDLPLQKQKWSKIMKDKIVKSYKQSKNIYDDVITHSKWWSKLYMKLFWKGVDDNEIADRLLEYIPKDFSGKLLDVPVGTAVFTYRKYQELQKAEIVCLDYSIDMLEQARMRFAEHSVNNVKAIHGDVSKLPFEDKSFDIVLCMNGVHAFPEKEKAYREIRRVLKQNGKLLACFYIRGESKISDMLVKTVLEKKGWFNAPFETSSSLKARIDADYTIEDFHVRGAMVYFLATKKQEGKVFCQ